MSTTSTHVKPLLNVTDIAARLGVSDRTVRQWIRDGRGGTKLSAMRAGETGMWFIDPQDLEDFLTSNNSDDT